MGAKRVYLHIPVSSTAGILTWDQTDLEFLGSKVLYILEKVGMRIEGKDNLRLLLDAGARVHPSTGIVRFSSEQVEDTIQRMRECSPAVEHRQVTTFNSREQYFGMGGGANIYFDWETRQAVASMRKHLRDLAWMAEGLPAIRSISPPIQVKDTHPLLEPISSFALLIQNTTEAMRVYSYIPVDPRQIKWMFRLGNTVAAKRGYQYGINNQEYIKSPLTIADRALKTIDARVEFGVGSIGIGSMAIAGLTAPVTVAGTVLLQAAEILGGLTVVRLLWPQVDLYGIAGSGIMNMANARVSYSSPRVQIQQFACVDLFRRYFGCEIAMLTCYRDANEPGMQACYESAFLSMLFHCIDAPPYQELGMLANGNLFSPEQFVLDMQMVAEMRELLYGFEMSEEAMGLNLIEQTNFDQWPVIEHPHTLAHFKEELPFCNFWPRGLTATALHEEFQTDKLLAQAHETYLAALAQGKQAQPDTELNNEVEEIVKEAAADLAVPYEPFCE